MRLRRWLVVPGSRKGDRVACLAQVGDEVWSGSSGSTVTVYDGSSGRVLRQTEAPRAAVFSAGDDCATFLVPVGRFVWCGSSDGTISIFNPSTVAIRQLGIGGSGSASEANNGAAVTCCATGPRFVWTGGADCSLRAWDPSTGSLRATLRSHTNWVRCVLCVGARVWSGSDDCTIRVWREEDVPDIADESAFGKVPSALVTGHAGGVLALLRVGSTVWSASADRSIKVWDAQGARMLDDLRGHTGWVTCLALKDGLVWSGSLDRTVRCWNPSTGKCVKVLKRHGGGVWSILACDGLPCVWSGAGDSSLCIWETAESTVHESGSSVSEQPRGRSSMPTSLHISARDDGDEGSGDGWRRNTRGSTASSTQASRMSRTIPVPAQSQSHSSGSVLVEAPMPAQSPRSRTIGDGDQANAQSGKRVSTGRTTVEGRGSDSGEGAKPQGATAELSREKWQAHHEYGDDRTAASRRGEELEQTATTEFDEGDNSDGGFDGEELDAAELDVDADAIVTDKSEEEIDLPEEDALPTTQKSARPSAMDFAATTAVPQPQPVPRRDAEVVSPRPQKPLPSIPPKEATAKIQPPKREEAKASRPAVHEPGPGKNDTTDQQISPRPSQPPSQAQQTKQQSQKASESAAGTAAGSTAAGKRVSTSTTETTTRQTKGKAPFVSGAPVFYAAMNETLAKMRAELALSKANIESLSM